MDELGRIDQLEDAWYCRRTGMFYLSQWVAVADHKNFRLEMRPNQGVLGDWGHRAGMELALVEG